MAAKSKVEKNTGITTCSKSPETQKSYIILKTNSQPSI
jgi:hypothetical protein